MEEKNKQLETELNYLKEKFDISNNTNENSKNELDLLEEEKNKNNREYDESNVDKNIDTLESIFNMKDLYRSTILKTKNKKIQNKINESIILKDKKKKFKGVVESFKINSIEKEFNLNKLDSEEIKRKEEEEFERQILEEEEKKNY